MAVLNWVGRQIQFTFVDQLKAFFKGKIEIYNGYLLNKQIINLNSYYKNRTTLVDHIDFTGTKPVRMVNIFIKPY